MLQSAFQTGSPDTYSDRVLKYVPADVVAAWVAANGIIKEANPRPTPVALWIIFGVGLVLCALWTYKEVSRTNRNAAPVQMIVSSGAFAVWVYALGGPFPDWLGFYHAYIGSLLLIAYTLLVGLVVPDSFATRKTGRLKS